MNSFREEEVSPYERHSRESSLKVKDHAPGLERDDYSAYERPEGWADERAGEEPAHCCGALGGPVDVPNARSADVEEGGPFEGCQDAEDEVGHEVGGEGCAEGAG